jgi:hypothetical protein
MARDQEVINVHPLDHIVGISVDVADHVEQGGLQSNNVYVLLAIEIAGILEVPMFSRSYHTP